MHVCMQLCLGLRFECAMSYAHGTATCTLPSHTHAHRPPCASCMVAWRLAPCKAAGCMRACVCGGGAARNLPQRPLATLRLPLTPAPRHNPPPPIPRRPQHPPIRGLLRQRLPRTQLLAQWGRRQRRPQQPQSRGRPRGRGKGQGERGARDAAADVRPPAALQAGRWRGGGAVGIAGLLGTGCVGAGDEGSVLGRVQG